MALSMSVSAGKHNARHNTDLAYRAKLPNVDPRLSRLNLTIKDEPIGKAYDRIFGKSLSDYNAKQKSKGHGERCIADYHAKIEGAWKADSAKSIATRRALERPEAVLRVRPPAWRPRHVSQRTRLRDGEGDFRGSRFRHRRKDRWRYRLVPNRVALRRAERNVARPHGRDSIWRWQQARA